MLPRRKLVVLATTVIASMGVATAAATAAPITGSGSTLVQPLMAQWTSHYSGGQVTYAGVGSGQGIVNVSNGVTNFGASDAPLTSTQHASCHGCIEIPWALTATAIGYNLNGVRSLHISGPVLAKIYLGQITNWNDPQIRSSTRRSTSPTRRSRRCTAATAPVTPTWPRTSCPRSPAHSPAGSAPRPRSASPSAAVRPRTRAWRPRSCPPPARSATSPRRTRSPSRSRSPVCRMPPATPSTPT